MMRSCLAGLGLALSLSTGRSAAAQAAAPSPAASLPVPRHALEFWGGIAAASPDLGVLGRVPGISFRAIGLRYTRVLGATDGTSRTTEYSFDLIPLARTSPPYRSLHGTSSPCPPGKLCVAPPFSHLNTMAFGVNPLGLSSRWNAAGRLSPSLGVTGGALYFDRKVPTTRGARFNFTTALEAGLRIGDPREPVVTLTYRFHHLSNAGTAAENPGVASHVLGIGLRRSWY